MSNSEIRVRFAPSPTGPLHIGGVRTALYNYLFAKKNNGKFILRIEDTDQNRYVEGAEQYIQESLKWCGMDLDEGPEVGGDYGPYRQSERKESYKKYVNQLIDSGHAYIAFDSPEELDAMRERLKASGSPIQQYNSVTRTEMKNSFTLDAEDVKQRIASDEKFVVRVNIPENEEIVFQDVVRGEVKFNSSQLDDKVLYKSDGLPTYHMANVVDDHLMKISHVIRGEEWLSSTPLHVLLYRFLGWSDTMPQFVHLPLILKPSGKGKLSKRDGDQLGFPVFPMNWNAPDSDEVYPGFKEAGFNPSAFNNMLAFLGWNPGSEIEIFSMDGLIQVFSLEHVGKSGARFDYEKSKWFNQQHLKELSDNDLYELLKDSTDLSEKELISIISLYKERATFAYDILNEAESLFNSVENYDEKTIRKKWKPERKNLFLDLASEIVSVDELKTNEIEEQVKSFMEKNSLGFGDVLPILRIALTGKMQGPSVFEMIKIVGVDLVSEKLNIAFNEFDKIAGNS